jgi:putative ABC transport system ATP-binding protein
MSYILEVDHLTRAFSDVGVSPQVVLKDISFNLEEGEFLAIFGRAGSGKSMLLSNLLAMDHATSGTVRFRGRDVNQLTEIQMEDIRLNSIGFVSQQFPLQQNLTIRDNILQPAFQAGTLPKSQVEARAEELMAWAGIEQHARMRVSNSDETLLMRAIICRELINDPALLVLNSINQSIESGEAIDILESVFAYRLKHPIAILLTTDDPEIAAYADRVLFFSHGEIKAELQLGRLGDFKAGHQSRVDQLTSQLESLDI